MTTAIRLLNFFKKPDGPIGMLAGGFLVAIALGAWFNPYYEQWQQIQTKVPVHSKKIAEIERQQTKFEKRFKQMEKSQDSLQENQLLLICTSPNIGESWKQRKKCGEHGYPISDNDE